MKFGRKRSGTGDWQICDSDTDGFDITPMRPLPKGMELEFRCFAVDPDNRMGPPSNTVMVVL